MTTRETIKQCRDMSHDVDAYDDALACFDEAIAHLMRALAVELKTTGCGVHASRALLAMGVTL